MKLPPTEISKIFFTSDTHFGHANIIKYCNRPFASVEEMNEAMIKNWNAKIPPDGLVYHLGDFAFLPDWEITKIRGRLNGKIVLIRGNHDHDAVKTSCFERIYDVYTVKVSKSKSVFLSHYAHKTWDRSHHGRYHLYGHTHGGLPDDPTSRSFDVGVDPFGFHPLSFSEVDNIMQNYKKWEPIKLTEVDHTLQRFLNTSVVAKGTV